MFGKTKKGMNLRLIQNFFQKKTPLTGEFFQQTSYYLFSQFNNRFSPFSCRISATS